MDPILITSAVAAGNHTIGILKGVVEGLKSTGKAEMIQQIIEAQMTTMDLLGKCHELQGENTKLSEEIAKLKSEAELSKGLTFNGSVYYLKSEGPYCQKCYDSDRKLVRLHQGNYSDSDFNSRYFCYVCNHYFV